MGEFCSTARGGQDFAFLVIEFQSPGISSLIELVNTLRCRMVLSSGEVISQYIFVSSAKIVQRVPGVRKFGRSLMYSKKSSGPRIDLCGTPDMMGNQLDEEPWTVTLLMFHTETEIHLIICHSKINIIINNIYF